jgi:hypothetical protein
VHLKPDQRDRTIAAIEALRGGKRQLMLKSRSSLSLLIDIL